MMPILLECMFLGVFALALAVVRRRCAGRALNYVLPLSVLLLTACGNANPDSAENADNLLGKADSMYQAGRYSSAKILIDSIDRVCRHQVAQRKQARVLLDRIKIKEETRNAQYLDSLIVLLEPEVESLMKQFVLSKDTDYVKEKIYTHRKQTVGYYPHTNLIARIHENGDLDLISVFTGYKLNHSQVEVRANDLFVTTGVLPVGKSGNYQFDDEGVRWEYLTFTPDTENGVMAFIASVDDKERLRVVLNGDKKHNYWLEPNDKVALRESYVFAGKLKELYTMKKQSRNAKEKVERLNQKLSGL
ncbi:MAG: hypothetical protein J5808_01225 [Paludibacteraceae bacterium]|nr:hypothetical protein [Paludibacteraceae bacterium]